MSKPRPGTYFDGDVNAIGRSIQALPPDDGLRTGRIVLSTRPVYLLSGPDGPSARAANVLAGSKVA
jgi:hypothetical protein